MKAAINKALDRYQGDFRSTMRQQKIRYASVNRVDETLVVKFKDQDNLQQGLQELKDNYREVLDFDDDNSQQDLTVSVSLKEAARTELQNFAVQQNITTLRKRVNELGVAEPVIQREGIERIVVQLPGVQDTARAKELLGATATLEFRLVDEQADAFAAQESGQIPFGDKLYLSLIHI